MANPDHESVVKRGAAAIRQWREAHPEEELDLRDVHLEDARLEGADLQRADLKGAHLEGAHLDSAYLEGAHLDSAYLEGAFLHDAHLRDTHLEDTHLVGAHLERARLQHAHLEGADLEGAHLEGAHLDGTHLERTNLYSAHLEGADLQHAHLEGADLQRADLQHANLHAANLHAANLREANLSRTDLGYVQKAPQAYALETVQCTSDALYFETCERCWPEWMVDWERLRVMGRLPLFGISYTALIFIPIAFYGRALYNAQVELIRKWFEQVRTWTVQTPDLPIHITNLLNQLTPVVLEHLHTLPIPRQSLLLVVSTILLAAGATLYTFFCPSRIKEFSRTQWCDQFGRSLLHYWPLAWKHRYIRLVCAVCYILGGAGALWVILTKVGHVLVFILKNSSFSLL